MPFIYYLRSKCSHEVGKLQISMLIFSNTFRWKCNMTLSVSLKYKFQFHGISHFILVHMKHMISKWQLPFPGRSPSIPNVLISHVPWFSIVRILLWWPCMAIQFARGGLWQTKSYSILCSIMVRHLHRRHHLLLRSQSRHRCHLGGWAPSSIAGAGARTKLQVLELRGANWANHNGELRRQKLQCLCMNWQPYITSTFKNLP